ncbi:2-dehydropantoate 2-reductase [Dysgonomonas sp. PFB1-18]|uniref:putative 2-dehydropantoate 2-reductase n=1 Tax=unclassified Dysgonomonas TaxID=2630389 RepID=UPI0024751D95|nr:MULTISPECIES: putative 2-dehydropantoate 2-reductase [unclassified Dysgonomonas]MDH6307782.1 2-dehydropantoate 2-reductase [Dysgonomonas sp. PF1-14]MDH6337700.1 2-dehydropantoate 2-reductase [Dysgonomonas sp. PF1-16]MDH6378924.1 2-dehydropantoate 2-reductase [Dysgonomonas sp. PFB1-18]MDH6396559.1 2-dehydropantoate 2-reductase [Dysgonomonas sp. PF1-23]
MSLKYAVIGTGAIGGYYGGRLANSGQEVHFLFHSDYEYVKQYGLRVDSVDGDFYLPVVNTYKAAMDMPKCDVVLVCLKSTNNYLLKDLLPPLLHKDTVVVLIQNGLGLEVDLHKDFPDLSIAGGLAFICSSKVGEGHIGHFDEGRLNLGSYSCADERLLEQISKDFIQAGVEVQVLQLDKARWMKLVWNIPYNGMTVVMNASTDQLMSNPDMEILLHEIMLEVIGGANSVADGRFTIPDSYADSILEMTRHMVPYSPSMKLDYDNKRPLEIEYIYSRPIEQARKSGFDMVRVSMLEKQLRFIQSQYIK